MNRRYQLTVTLLALFAMFAAACGDDADDAAPATTQAASSVADQDGHAEGADDEGHDHDEDMADASGFPVTIESAGGSWTLESAPQRIVSLSPSATESLFAIGAGSQVVAVDSFSNYPAEAPVTDLSGFEPNVEAIAAYDPDLVVIAYDANDLIAGLTELGIPVLMSFAPIDVESGYAGIEELGVAAGRVDETAAVVAEMRAAMDEALAAAPGSAVRVYHELDENHFSTSSASFIGSIYSSLGAENIADPADTDGYGFPQLTQEFIVEADPELIVITDQVAYTPGDVAARPGWGEVAAVSDGNIVVVNADVASRWGPRLPQFVAAIAEAMSNVAAAS